MSQPPLDLRAYSEMKDIMEEVLPELLKTFIDYMPGLLQELKQAIEASNADQLFGTAHRMKSSSNSLGALGLAQTCEGIEMIGRKGNAESSQELSVQLEEELNEVLEFFTEELQGLS